MSQSVVDRMKQLLSTGEDADVYFLVGDEDEKELLSAHKLVLRSASDIFEAMFRFDAKNEKAEFASANCPVEVTDVEPTAFKVMLSFIYTGDLSALNGDNYNIPGLVDASLQVPVSSLPNVFFAYAQAKLYELENFAYHCLFYIDENADTLIKSEEFLQIDQKLLCEILGRDELQISGEIFVWDAALRWSDAKCRQKGIECSAENRRQLLGPALFKIRFPLFSNEEFSEIIVSSNVLSKDEVIAVYQFHSLPNCRGISAGRGRIKLSHSAYGLFPMQFPTNGRISYRKKGTILMDIEKVSEFAREEVESSRWYSEKVYINGHPWKILAKIKAKGSTYNEKSLNIFLSCTIRKEENWSCKCSATIRIVSQKSGVTDFRREFDAHEFNDWEFPNFITFAELMDPEKGFYDKSQDKVTLAISIIVKEAKMEDK
ncbi:hypothetical protein niasHT_003316 [Heterodera trifolii]|uniref:BTB domain-containing protein n=1 Tax=Heterodera trifolii TaxID=157864 RepID=A0ABD2LXY5_9BILA